MRKSIYILAAGLLLCACRSEKSVETETKADTTASDTIVAEEEFVVNNDIGMAVRSMANTINIGAPLDSTDYNFAGVFTDGVGMPLFTDITGMPGKWEVEVIDSLQVKIRNLDPGNLQPFQLVEYLTENLKDDSLPIILQEETDRGESHIIQYSYGRTRMSVEMRPERIAATGEVAPLMEITLKADTTATPLPQ